MAVDMDTAATNILNYGRLANTANLTSYTQLIWIKPDATGQNCGLMTRGTAGGSSRRSLELRNSVTSSAIYTTHDRGTQDADAETAANAYTADTWICIGVTYDGTDLTLYTGLEGTPMADATSSRISGSGTEASDSGNANQYIGVYGGGGGPYNGKVYAWAIFDSPLSLGEMISWQFRPRPMFGCLAMGIPDAQGGSGTSELELISGDLGQFGIGFPLTYSNTGTWAENPGSVVAPYGEDSSYGPYVVAAGPASSAFPFHRYYGGLV